MLNKKDFNCIISLLDSNFFLNKKKNLKFVKKLIMYHKQKRSLVNITFCIKEYGIAFFRFESLFGFLPKINSITIRRKGKTKKIIFLRSVWVFKLFLNNEKKIDQALSYIFNLHNYLYLKFIINKKLKLVRFEEIFRHFVQKNIFVQHNSLAFDNNLYFKWLDFNRKFNTIKGISSWKYKAIHLFHADVKRLRFYECKFLIKSSFFFFFISPIKILLKNYRKLIIFLFKKYRKRKKDFEKAYILL